jgi:SAM-dependent methyltransferase
MRTLPDRFRWWAKRGRDIALDLMCGVDTGPEIAGERSPHAYDPAPWRTLDRAMRLASLQAAGASFVDLGCGKGRVLLSALAYPFARVVGVELSPTLAKIAEQNLRAARLPVRRACSSQVVCGDAREFPLPEGPSVAFFYNPFPIGTMLIVLENIGHSYLKDPRGICLIFYACSSSMSEVNEFLGSKVEYRARRLVSTTIGQRSLNIFELP